MPRVIDRLEAIGSLVETDCVVCRVLAEDPLVVAETERCVLLLPRLAIRWGHLMAVVRNHVVSFAQIDDAEWREASELSLRAARVLEQELGPARVYVASLGTARDDLPMTSPHIHAHVIPVYDRDDKPSGVLTWQHGVTVATEPEWQELRKRLRSAL